MSPLGLLYRAMNLPHKPIAVTLSVKKLKIEVKFKKELEDARDIPDMEHKGKKFLLLEDLHERDRDYYEKGRKLLDGCLRDTSGALTCEERERRLNKAGNIFIFLVEYYRDFTELEQVESLVGVMKCYHYLGNKRGTERVLKILGGLEGLEGFPEEWREELNIQRLVIKGKEENKPNE